MTSISRKVGRPRPVRATLPVPRDEFDRLKAQLGEVIGTVERLQQDYQIQVRRSGELHATVHRLVQHLQAIAAALPKPERTD
jgi:hypothetical protein